MRLSILLRSVMSSEKMFSVDFEVFGRVQGVRALTDFVREKDFRSIFAF